MDLSTEGAGFIRAHEGFVGKWYLDPVKVGTIGVGFTWASDAFREWWGLHRPGQRFGPGATVTRAEAEDALAYLVKREYGAAVDRFLGKVVPQHVFDGAVSPVFNLGEGSLDWRWAQALKKGEYEVAADLLRTTGTTAKGKRLAGLVARRKEEAELIATGDYTIGAAVAPVDALADGMLVRGERGDAVKALQRDLKALGHYTGIEDGVFGYGTEAAVMAFQRTVQLEDDGYAGPKTLAAVAPALKPAPVEPSAQIVAQPPVVVSPAPIGHNGGPALDAAPIAPTAIAQGLSPIEQMNKPVKGAQANAGAAGLGAVVLMLWAASGYFPEGWKTPEMMAALGAIFTAVPGIIAGFVASYRARDKRFQPAPSGGV